MKSHKKIYQFHVANLKEIEHAMERVARFLRDAISKDDDKTTSSFMRLFALLLGAWAEVRLKKLLFEPNGFNEENRETILKQNSQFEQWKKSLELGFRRQYNKPNVLLSANSLTHSAFSRYSTLSEMLYKDLRSIILLRNKLAHGQWIYPLNKEGNDIAQKQMDALRIENILSLQFKKTLIKSLASSIHDLVVSRPTFERDFDNHFRTIIETRRNLQNRDYEKYVTHMRQKYIRGQNKRRKLG